MIVRWLSEFQSGAVLAVDADSNVNLNDLLGISVVETIGSIREEMRKATQNLPGGMSKAQFLEYKIQASLVETPSYDLIAMGRPEGPGCYCYANNLLRDILHTLSKNYRYIIIDNEAGMEHLSRRTTQNIDYLLVVSDPTVRGVLTAARISRLLDELDTRIGKKCVILNRVQRDVPPAVCRALEKKDLRQCLCIPEDNSLFESDQKGNSIWTLPGLSPAFLAVDTWMKTVINTTPKGQ